MIVRAFSSTEKFTVSKITSGSTGDPHRPSYALHFGQSGKAENSPRPYLLFTGGEAKL
jgi:hypothetical protein